MRTPEQIMWEDRASIIETIMLEFADKDDSYIYGVECTKNAVDEYNRTGKYDVESYGPPEEYLMEDACRQPGHTPARMRHICLLCAVHKLMDGDLDYLLYMNWAEAWGETK